MLVEIIRRGWQKPTLINYILYPLSAVYKWLMVARRQAYKKDILQSHAAPLPVIVVGNLSVGGTGKTPLVIAIASALKNHGYKPAIISRGYGGNIRAPRRVQADDDFAAVGDEPILLARAGDAPVVVGKSRLQCANWVAANSDCNIIISDDGFQHLQLKRKVDIVVADAKRFGNNWCLPAGPLREPTRALRDCDLMVIHNATPAAGEYKMQTHITQARNLANAQVCSLEEFKGKPVHAVAALGNPQRFFNQLRDIGLDIIEHSYRDHRPFTADDFEFNQQPQAAVLMTEKDAVKCVGLVKAAATARFWSIPLQVELPEEFISALIKKLNDKK